MGGMGWSAVASHYFGRIYYAPPNIALNQVHSFSPLAEYSDFTMCIYISTHLFLIWLASHYHRRWSGAAMEYLGLL